MKICVFGAGAIGGYVAAQLWHAGNAVCVVARGPHLEAIRRHGLNLIAAGRETIAHVRASDQPSELGPQDFVICALKAPKPMKALRFHDSPARAGHGGRNGHEWHSVMVLL